MFATDVLTVWVEALKAIFDGDHPNEELRDIPVLTEYPLEEINYPGLWVNFLPQGEVRNVGIGHIEYEATDAGTHEVYRWRFSGTIEITIGAMGNLERALLVDEVTRNIAVARVDQNAEGILRSTVMGNDLIGLSVVWEAFQVTGFAETPGTPWGTDDVIYEATVMLTLEGEVVMNPENGVLVPLSEVRFVPLLEGDPGVPVPGTGGWI